MVGTRQLPVRLAVISRWAAFRGVPTVGNVVRRLLFPLQDYFWVLIFVA
jgi:hypothetical protein